MEYVNTKIKCDICSINVPRANMAKHKKTEKHKHNMEISVKSKEEQQLKDSKAKLDKIQYINHLKNKFSKQKPLYKHPVHQ